jgi:hypothetical protein
MRNLIRFIIKLIKRAICQFIFDVYLEIDNLLNSVLFKISFNKQSK